MMQTQESPETYRWVVASIVLLFATIVLSAVLGFRIFHHRVEIASLLDDFELETGLLTRLVLSTSYSFLIPALALVGIAKEIALSGRRLTTVLNAIHLLVVFVIWQLYVVGAIDPQLQLIHELSK